MDEAPIVRFVNLLITQAVTDRASDIHVEPAETDLRIRFRVDGVLHEVMRSPRSIQAGVISRLKIMADINIAERRLPQDGRMSLTVGGRTVDLRVATLPTVHGEKVVLRILDTSQARLDLADLGFRPDALRRYEACYRKPYGTILVTGPTGSGKSTTLYATLNVLNEAHRNIITVEDPVEYRLAGSQPDPGEPPGRTHLRLRPALHPPRRPRHHPGGRDPRPGDGRHRHRGRPHRPPGAVHPPHQRRRLYPHAPGRDGRGALPRHQRPRLRAWPSAWPGACATAARSRTTRRKRNWPRPAGPPAELGERPQLYRPVGCPACAKTGYRGRLAIQEVMVVSEEIERMIIERFSSDEVKKVAVSQGMAPLREDGLRKVAQGVTTLEEVFRVVA